MSVTLDSKALCVAKRLQECPQEIGKLIELIAIETL
ncbi:hypothetical protein GGD46_005963 [Rhizobium lusitanum]|uniref:Uncharacterized protein n=1 Tax=Rhizobium lusitanum TaxID=293958 RepID=A0A7X0IWU3_9HYPH|nr:hypothetical protein [Rhizobium lusitanum]